MNLSNMISPSCKARQTSSAWPLSASATNAISKAALERQQFLVKEMNHRVKNSLTIVTSLLQMQARDVGWQGNHEPV